MTAISGLACERPPATATTAVTAAPLGRTLAVVGAPSPAIATDARNVYFGDLATNELRVVPKAGGRSARVATPAPRALAIGGGLVSWVAADGTRVLQRSLDTPSAEPSVTLLRDGTFEAIAAHGRDVYVGRVVGAHSELLLVRERTVEILAAVDGDVRALAVGDDGLFVLSDSAIARVDRSSGRFEPVFAGARFARLAVDDAFVYSSAPAGVGATQSLLRLPARGGASLVLEHGIGAAPIAVHAKEVFYFDADQPTLRRTPSSGGASTIVARSSALSRPAALAVDANGIYLAVEGDVGRSAAVVAMTLPLPSTERP